MSDGESGDGDVRGDDVSPEIGRVMDFLEAMGCPIEWAFEEPGLVADLVINHVLTQKS